MFITYLLPLLGNTSRSVPLNERSQTHLNKVEANVALLLSIDNSSKEVVDLVHALQSDDDVTVEQAMFREKFGFPGERLRSGLVVETVDWAVNTRQADGEVVRAGRCVNSQGRTSLNLLDNGYGSLVLANQARTVQGFVFVLLEEGKESIRIGVLSVLVVLNSTDVLASGGPNSQLLGLSGFLQLKKLLVLLAKFHGGAFLVLGESEWAPWRESYPLLLHAHLSPTLLGDEETDVRAVLANPSLTIGAVSELVLDSVHDGLVNNKGTKELTALPSEWLRESIRVNDE